MGKDTKPIVEMKKIGKTFGKVRVLENIDFDIYPGEVHVLAGENGAGKSTLINILSGVHTDYEGEICMNGQQIKPASPADANRLGISVIHQELSIIPFISITENLFLGRNLKNKAGLVKSEEQTRIAKELLKDIGVDIDVNKKAEHFSVSIQQLVEICKATSINAKVIVMDEPSSALNQKDVQQLFRIVEKLKAENYGIVYITHKMEEIERLADRVTVLRDGKLVGTSLEKDLPTKELIRWMVGREVTMKNYREGKKPGDELFRIEHLTMTDPSVSGKKIIDDVSLYVRSGEVLGIEALQGAGASELLQSIFGVYNRRMYEKMTLEGREINISNPKESIDNNVCLLTNDRKGNGCVAYMNIVDNVLLPTLRRFANHGLRNVKKEKETVMKIGKELNFRIPSYESPMTDLSGGNQQKVILGKWMVAKPKVMLLDEPTKGIDIGAKEEIYNLINSMTDQGIAVILITSEMPELMALSDRIVVMHRGRITAEFEGNKVSAEELLEAAMGKEEKQ